jgi:K+-sensing histidine kinase KdpD
MAVAMAMHGAEGRALTVERDRLLNEARLAGMGRADAPTLEAVDRRRTQLWTMAGLTIVGIFGILVLGRISEVSGWAASSRLQALLLSLSVGVLVYVADRERRLRVVTRLLVDERALTTALVQRLGEVRTLLGVAKALNSSLGLDVILSRIVDAATGMLYAERGSVLLTDGEVLRVVAASGPDGNVGEELAYSGTPAGQAARTWELVSTSGDERNPPAIYAPILHASQLLGVLAVVGHRSRPFTDYDNRAALLFAEQAAFAIAATHKAEASKWEEAERVESSSRRVEVMAGAVSDLRDPVSSMVAATKMLRRERLGDSERVELASVIDRQVERLARAVDEILSATVPAERVRSN